MDDESIIIEVTQQMLERLGYSVLVAKSGSQALELYSENRDRVDAVILDMIMPENCVERNAALPGTGIDTLRCLWVSSF